MNNILGLSSVDSRQDSLQDQLVDTNAPESVPDNNSTSREYGLLQNPPLSTFDKIWGPPIEEDCLGPHETPFSEDEFIIHHPQMQASQTNPIRNKYLSKNEVTNAIFELAAADESPWEEKKVPAANVKQ